MGKLSFYEFAVVKPWRSFFSWLLISYLSQPNTAARAGVSPVSRYFLTR